MRSTGEPLDDRQVVADFLPPPEQTIFNEGEAKATDDKYIK